MRKKPIKPETQLWKRKKEGKKKTTQPTNHDAKEKNKRHEP